MKLLLTLTLTLFFFSLKTVAQELPFHFEYNDSGLIQKVTLNPSQATTLENTNFINEVKVGLEAMSVMTLEENTLPGLESLKPDEQDAFLQSQSLINNLELTQTLDDPKLKIEFGKLIDRLKKEKLFYLLADTTGPAEFDNENTLVEVIENALEAAEKLLGLSPAFNAFEFIVDEYLEALISRREFAQNVLIVCMQTGPCEFDQATQSKILTSIFYSRISIFNIPARKKAAKAWDTFGLEKYAKWTKRCATTATSFLNDCFFHDGKKVYNLIDRRVKFSKLPSIAFNFKNPNSLETSRYIILGAKFLLKMAPIPGLLKTPVKSWLNSQYKQQRRTEGLLYGASVTQAGQEGFAPWIKRNTINKTIKF